MPDPTLEQLDQSLKQLRKEFDHDSDGLHIVTGVLSKLRDQVDDIDKDLKQLRKEFDHDSDGLHIVTGVLSKLRDQVDDGAKSTLDAIKDLAKRVAALEKKK